MDLDAALRTTGAIREFSDEPVPDEVIARLLDSARYAPSGGNRQAWRVVLVKDPEMRARIGEVYLESWHEYVAHVLAGFTPFSPTMSDAQRARAEELVAEARQRTDPEGFAENFARVPVMLCVVADLSSLAATDRDLGRYTIVGGASVYPFVWSLLLAAHEQGLGGVMTTVATRRERAVLDLLGASTTSVLAAIVALGVPRRRPSRLSRRRVDEFATLDRIDGERLAAP